MNTQLHFAAQYLAMAGKRFLPQQADDSHTNMGFDPESQSFETWPLHDGGLKLQLYIPNLSLKWSDGGIPALDLHGKTHAEVVEWLTTTAKEMGLVQSYGFNLHYDLPFAWSADYRFEVTDQEALNQLLALRIMAHQSIQSFLEAENLTSAIRTWPHHFDTGALVPNGTSSGIAIGLGMAIPDSMVDTHYFYLSGYQGHESVATAQFKSLTLGEWKNEGFKGAVLPTMEQKVATVVDFFKEAFAQYKGYSI